MDNGGVYLPSMAGATADSLSSSSPTISTERSRRRARSTTPADRTRAILQTSASREVQMLSEEDIEYESRAIPDFIFTPCRKQARNRYYCITYFGSRMQDILQMMCRRPWDEQIKFFVCQAELCPVTSRHHWQCYIELYKATRVGTIQNDLFGEPGMFCAERAGPKMAARDYCVRSNKRAPGPREVVGPFYIGHYRVEDADVQGDPGKADTFARARDGESSTTIALDADAKQVQFVARNHQFLDKLAADALLTKARDYEKDRELTCAFFYGDSGTGKTYLASAEANKISSVHQIHRQTSNSKKFEGMPQWCDHLIIEDYPGNTYEATFLLALADKVLTMLDKKYGSVPTVYRRFTMTSNVLPEKFRNPDGSPWIPEHIVGFYRRMHWIIRFTRSEPMDGDANHETRSIPPGMKCKVGDWPFGGWRECVKSPGGMVPIDWNFPTLPAVLPPPPRYGPSMETPRDFSPVPTRPSVAPTPRQVESIDTEH